MWHGKFAEEMTIEELSKYVITHRSDFTTRELAEVMLRVITEIESIKKAL